MNDLFSTNSFNKYTDLKSQRHMDEIELGIPASAGYSTNLDKFFGDVENVKEDMMSLEQIYLRLQDLNEETKTVHSSKMMKDLRALMDTDIEQVLRRANIVKQKLEAVDRSNAAHRKIPGCGPGSSTDRTRTSVVAGLGNKLKDLMDDFQGLRGRIAAEYKEMVGRQYYTMMGERPNEDTIEMLISMGESESFLQKAIQEHGRGRIMDTISEIQDRHDAVKEIEKSLMDLNQLFLDMAALVEAHGHQLNDIESHVAHASSFVRRGSVELEEARDYQKGSRKWYCIAFLLGTLLVVILLMPILVTIIRPL